MVFNILIDNTDDPEKNPSLLVHEPSERQRFELAPAYDILRTNSGLGYQEFICGAFGRDSTLENVMSECESFGLSPKNAAQEVVNVIDVVNTWQTHFGEIGVRAKDIETLEQTIDSEPLRSQRIKFDPNRFGAITKKKSPRIRWLNLMAVAYANPGSLLITPPTTLPARWHHVPQYGHDGGLDLSGLLGAFAVWTCDKNGKSSSCTPSQNCGCLGHGG